MLQALKRLPTGSRKTVAGHKYMYKLKLSNSSTEENTSCGVSLLYLPRVTQTDRPILITTQLLPFTGILAILLDPRPDTVKNKNREHVEISDLRILGGRRNVPRACFFLLVQ